MPGEPPPDEPPPDEPKDPVCGNGVIETGETCDDSDVAGGDGCSADCQTEEGWTCTGEPSACTVVCGDGKIIADEVCDDGNAVDHDGCTSCTAFDRGYACWGEPSTCRGVHFVCASATGAGDGTSWQDAFTQLQDALARAAVSGKEVWVGAGTYAPAQPGGERSQSFTLSSGMRLYGGFDCATYDFEARDPAMHVTVLTGDIDGDDGEPTWDSSNNAYHVVRMEGTDATPMVLDGFAITGGYAEDSSPNGNLGGGVLIEGGVAHLRRVELSDNYAYHHGGGLAAIDAELHLRSVQFFRNTAAPGNAVAYGGGLYFNITSGGNTLRAVDVHFEENSADNGSALAAMNRSTAELKADIANARFVRNHQGTACYVTALSGSVKGTCANCLFLGNDASGRPSAYNGSLWSNALGPAHFAIINSAFVGNDGNRALAVWGNNQAEAEATLELLNTAFENNTSDDLYVSEATSREDHVCRSSADPDPAMNCVPGLTAEGYPQEGSLVIDAGNANPLTELLVDALDLDEDGDVTEKLPIDLDGRPRFVDQPAVTDSGEGWPPIDIGPFEY